MPKGDIVRGILVDKLIFGGNGLGRLPDGRKLVITGGVVPGSTVSVRILRARSSHAEGQVWEVEKPSPLEQPLPKHWQVYGGCKWLPIPYEKQLEIKQQQVREAFHHLKEAVAGTVFHPIIASPKTEGYRNKVEFSFGVYFSDAEGVRDTFRFGFHKQGEFSKVINCSYCVLGDEETNTIFKEVDRFARASGLPTYDPVRHSGFWRHLVVRRSHNLTGTMLVFSVKSDDPAATSVKMEELKIWAAGLSKTMPYITSVWILHNMNRADIVDGDPELIAGERSLREKILGLTFEIHPRSFFQTNTLGAEKLYQTAASFIKKPGGVLLDLYAGTGTIGTVLASKFDKVYSVELVASATEDCRRNLDINSVQNVEPINASVEDFCKDFLAAGKKADTIVVDPPRSGMHPDAPVAIRAFGAQEIIYVSCNPATLARDLAALLEGGLYRLTDVAAVDMFPHTHHIETVVRLEKVV